MNRAILKINTSGAKVGTPEEIEVFTSLRKLFNKYLDIEKHDDSIVDYLTRRKTNYVSDNYTLRRVFVNET